MRTISLLLIVPALAACSTAPPMPRTAEAQAELNQALAGLEPGQPVACLPNVRTNRMITIDDNTVLFRSGGTLYRNELSGRCNQLGSGHYSLVTRSSTGRLCRGEIAEVVDVSTGMTLGSCALGDFVAYRPS